MQKKNIARSDNTSKGPKAPATEEIARSEAGLLKENAHYTRVRLK